MIVDDNQLNQMLLTEILEDNTYNITTAINGIEAIDLVKKEKPSLILMDIMMPDMNGFEACKQIKQDAEFKNIPIIFITALSETAEKLKAFEAGGVDYITKPFIKEEVLARINVHLKLKQALEKLADLSIKDEMTGVYNRRHAYEIINNHISKARRVNENFVLCFIDIDNLKKINDRFGHSEGDSLIITVSDSLKEMIRSYDYLFRMGGDEFLILFPNSKLQESQLLLERLREKLHNQSIKDTPIDFSFGFSCFQYHDEEVSAHELITKADTQMYEEKDKKKHSN